MAFAIKVNGRRHKRKAHTTSLVWTRPVDVVPVVQTRQQLLLVLMVSDSRYRAVGGGMVVAGIGASDGTNDQDIAIAELALR